MRLPIQSQPVPRNIPSQPFAFGGDSGAHTAGGSPAQRVRRPAQRLVR